jgi:hypothetical protein
MGVLGSVHRSEQRFPNHQPNETMKATFTIYSENPFDLNGDLVAPYLAIATAIPWDCVHAFLINGQVAVSANGWILGD